MCVLSPGRRLRGRARRVASVLQRLTSTPSALRARTQLREYPLNLAASDDPRGGARRATASPSSARRGIRRAVPSGSIPRRKGRLVLLRKPLLAIAIAVGCCAFGTEIAACSSNSAAPPPRVRMPRQYPRSACADGGLTVAFNPMYSAFDGTHIFQIPAVVRGSNGQVTWSADSTMVGMQTDPERPNEVLIQMLKRGNVAINVKSTDGKCGSSLLFISAAADSDWEIGNVRYNDGQSLHLAAGATTGGPAARSRVGRRAAPACTNCHGETATNGPFTDVSHTPEQTGGFSDDNLLNIILRGDFPDGGYFDPSIVHYAAWHNFHRWVDITADQQKGIITYLDRSRRRAQKGALNFDAFDLARLG